MEYALGTEPGTANTAPVLAGRSGDYLTFTLTYGVTDDAVLTPQISTDLSAWSGAGITEVSTVINPNGSLTTVWRAPSTISAGQRLYFRVQAAVQ